MSGGIEPDGRIGRFDSAGRGAGRLSCSDAPFERLGWPGERNLQGESKTERTGETASLDLEKIGKQPQAVKSGPQIRCMGAL